jgi:hypothetical protein
VAEELAAQNRSSCGFVGETLFFFHGKDVAIQQKYGFKSGKSMEIPRFDVSILSLKHKAVLGLKIENGYSLSFSLSLYVYVYTQMWLVSHKLFFATNTHDTDTASFGKCWPWILTCHRGIVAFQAKSVNPDRSKIAEVVNITLTTGTSG